VAPELGKLHITVAWGQEGKYRERFFKITRTDANEYEKPSIRALP
jgi:hypothetical protein